MFYNYLLFKLHRIIIKSAGIKFYNAAAILGSVIIKCVDGIAKTYGAKYGGGCRG